MEYDVIVIGAGPAGLMAAIRAAKRGVRVLVLEKGPFPARKLMLTGGGRCNLTNLSETSPRSLAARFGPNGRFLIAALTRCGVPETLDLFRTLDIKTVTEQNGRVFPQSGRAGDIRQALVKESNRCGGIIRTNASVARLVAKNGLIDHLELSTGEKLAASAYIIATGGKSYGATGSTGDAYRWLKALGHTIIAPRPALAPIEVRERSAAALRGVSAEALVSVRYGGQIVATAAGSVLFTGTGLSGPAIHDLSRFVSPNDTIILDLVPDQDQTALERSLQITFDTHGRRQAKAVLAAFVPAALAAAICVAAGVTPDRPASAVTAAARRALANSLKTLVLTAGTAASFDQAMATAGGVTLSEIDPKTMRSKLVKNLYLCGEVLDLDGPTGGYNLQMCWSTGYVAGESVK